VAGFLDQQKEFDGPAPSERPARLNLFFAGSVAAPELVLGRGVGKAVLDGGCPGTAAGINDGRGNGDEARDHGIFQSFHTALIVQEILNRFHFVAPCFLNGLRFEPGFRTARTKKKSTGSAGVISGDLSDRILPITATFRVRRAECNGYASEARNVPKCPKAPVLYSKVKLLLDFWLAPDLSERVLPDGRNFVCHVEHCSQARICGITLLCYCQGTAALRAAAQCGKARPFQKRAHHPFLRLGQGSGQRSPHSHRAGKHWVSLLSDKL
jgi:hypothetical protein